jgi:hypothetical protein
MQPSHRLFSLGDTPAIWSDASEPQRILSEAYGTFGSNRIQLRMMRSDHLEAKGELNVSRDGFELRVRQGTSPDHRGSDRKYDLSLCDLF